MNHPSRFIPDRGAQYEKFLFTTWPGVHSMWKGDNKEWEVDRCQKVIGGRCQNDTYVEPTPDWCPRDGDRDEVPAAPLQQGIRLAI